MSCEICNQSSSFSWTDTHGVAQCWTCGTPYRIIHYEGKGAERASVEKPPELMIEEKYIPAIQAYWREKGRRIPSGCSFPGGQELASRDDEEAFYEWMDKNAKGLIAESQP